jgi:hypothetical protein
MYSRAVPLTSIMKVPLAGKSAAPQPELAVAGGFSIGCIGLAVPAAPPIGGIAGAPAPAMVIAVPVPPLPAAGKLVAGGMLPVVPAPAIGNDCCPACPGPLTLGSMQAMPVQVDEPGLLPPSSPPQPPSAPNAPTTALAANHAFHP